MSRLGISIYGVSRKIRTGEEDRASTPVRSASGASNPAICRPKSGSARESGSVTKAGRHSCKSAKTVPRAQDGATLPKDVLTRL